MWKEKTSISRPAWFASLTQHGDKPPFLLQYRSSTWFINGTIALAVFTDMFLYGVIVPVVPFALEEKVGVSENRVQHWVSVLIAIYGAALLAFSPICGWLADHTSSRRSPLLLGLLALLGATALLNVGSNVAFFVAGRILQGASGAVVWTVGLALLVDTVPQEHLARTMGYVSLGMSLGILISPLLGGVVFEHGGYNAVFAMCYALIGLDIILRLLLVEKKVAARWDPEAAETTRIAAANDPAAQHEGDSSVFDPEKASGDMSDSSYPGTASPEAEASAPEPNPTKKPLRERLPPVFSLLYSRRLLAALFAAVIQASLMTSFDGVLTIHVRRIFNFNSTAAGLLFLPLAIPTFLAPLFGALSDRIGGRYPASIGFLLAVVPLVCLRFVTQNTIEDKVQLCAFLAIIGVALASTFPPLMAEISGVVEAKEKKMLALGKPGYGKGGAYAQAYALFNVAFAAGCMVGPLIAGALVDKAGWGTMAYVLGILSGITSVPTYLWLGGWVFGKKEGEETHV